MSITWVGHQLNRYRGCVASFPPLSFRTLASATRTRAYGDAIATFISNRLEPTEASNWPLILALVGLERWNLWESVAPSQPWLSWLRGGFFAPTSKFSISAPSSPHALPPARPLPRSVFPFRLHKEILDLTEFEGRSRMKGKINGFVLTRASEEGNLMPLCVCLSVSIARARACCFVWGYMKLIFLILGRDI